MPSQVPGVGGRRAHHRLYVGIPRGDWGPVRQGVQTEFRKRANYAPRDVPRPIVGYTTIAGHKHHQMFVLTESWKEPLGAISEESLRRNNCESMREFRRQWPQRNRYRGFPPNLIVVVYRLRLWQPGDERDFSESIFHDLYGPFLRGR